MPSCRNSNLYDIPLSCHNGNFAHIPTFVGRCRITLVPLGRSGLNRRAFYRVTDADFANLANLRLRAEAQYSLALLHSPRSLRMTQVSTSEVKCGRAPSLQQKESSSGLHLCS
jgi:hypothetical protein